MNAHKLAIHLISVLFPAASLYLCWWLRGEVGEAVAGLVFVLLCANYFWLMRRLKKEQKLP